MASTPKARKSKQNRNAIERQRLEAALEEGLEETFPASGGGDGAASSSQLR
jgi:hypothetical protein